MSQDNKKELLTVVSLNTGSDVPIYDVIDLKEPQCPRQPEGSEADYSNMNKEKDNIYNEAATTSYSGFQHAKSSKSMKLIFMLAIFVGITVLLLIFGCLLALFLEVSALKSKTPSLDQVSPLLLQQINESLSSVKTEIEALSLFQGVKMQQLNSSIMISLSSVEEHLSDLSSIHDSRVQKLNSSIDDRLEHEIQELSNLQNEKLQHLNASTMIGFASVDECLSDLSSIHDSRVQELNSSIDYRLGHEIQELANVQNEKLQHLNTTLEVSLEDSLSRIQELNNSINLLSDYANILDSGVQQVNTSVREVQNRLSVHLNCASLPPSSPSGYYWVIAANGSVVCVYCDAIDIQCGGVAGGWRRVAGLDMTNSDHQCPGSLRVHNNFNKRTCALPYNVAGCSVSTFSTAGLAYSKVCGKVVAYQVGFTEAFRQSHISATVSQYHLDGIKLTHGRWGNEQHIWAFASALDEVGSHPESNCPCTNINISNLTTTPPAFVGNDYFCDTGVNRAPPISYSNDIASNIFYGDDPLWDGAGCGPLNTCCSFNNPPWFYKQLPQPTTDDIIMRECQGLTGSRSVHIESVSIYVQQ